MRQTRFYVFHGERWRDYIHNLVDPLTGDDNPPVITWDADLRPSAQPAAGLEAT